MPYRGENVNLVFFKLTITKLDYKEFVKSILPKDLLDYFEVTSLITIKNCNIVVPFYVQAFLGLIAN
jgi:hypothetical protein